MTPSRLLKDMLAVPSPSGHERDFAEFLLGALRAAGLKAEIDGAGNVLGWSGERGKPCLLLTSHTDTVGGEVSGLPGGGRVYGRGACDTKGWWAALLSVLDGFDGTVKVAGVVEEETTSKGTLALLETRKKGRFHFSEVLVGEPTSSHPCAGNRGRVAVELLIHGKSAHSCAPQRGLNPIHMAADVVRALRSLPIELHPHLGPGTVAVTTLSAGKETNVIPGSAVLTLDRRFSPGMTAHTCVRDIRAFLRGRFPGMRFGLRVASSFEPHIPDLHAPFFGRLSRAYRAAFRRPLHIRAFPAYSDAALFGRAGLPACVFGPGRLDEAHAEREFVTVKELERSGRFLRELIGTGPR